jgi:hypothetical protein
MPKESAGQPVLSATHTAATLPRGNAFMQIEREGTRQRLPDGRVVAQHCPAERWLSEICTVVQQEYAPSLSSKLPARLWGFPLFAFAESVTGQAAGEAPLLSFAIAPRGHTSLPLTRPSGTAIFIFQDRPNFTVVATRANPGNFFALSAAKSLQARTCCPDRRAAR